MIRVIRTAVVAREGESVPDSELSLRTSKPTVQK